MFCLVDHSQSWPVLIYSAKRAQTGYIGIGGQQSHQIPIALVVSVAAEC